MSVSDTHEIAEVKQPVQFWPAPMRLVLARQILEALSKPAAPLPTPERGPDDAEIAAVFRADSAPPDDAMVKEWLAKHRMRNYGP